MLYFTPDSVEQKEENIQIESEREDAYVSFPFYREPLDCQQYADLRSTEMGIQKDYLGLNPIAKWG